MTEGRPGWRPRHGYADGVRGAFQNDNALPVQPDCDQQCRTALGLSRPKQRAGLTEPAAIR